MSQMPQRKSRGPDPRARKRLERIERARGRIAPALLEPETVADGIAIEGAANLEEAKSFASGFPTLFQNRKDEWNAARAVYEWIVGEHFEQKWGTIDEPPETDVCDDYDDGFRLSVAKFRSKSKSRNCMVVSYGTYGKWTIRVIAYYHGIYVTRWGFDHISGDDGHIRRFVSRLWPDYRPPPDRIPDPSKLSPIARELRRREAERIAAHERAKANPEKRKQPMMRIRFGLDRLS